MHTLKTTILTGALAMTLGLGGLTICRIAHADPAPQQIRLQWQTVSLTQAAWDKMLAQANNSTDAITELLLKDSQDTTVSTSISTYNGGVATITATAGIPYDVSPPTSTQNYVTVGQTITLQPTVMPDKRIRVGVQIQDSQPSGGPVASGAPPAVTTAELTVTRWAQSGKPFLVELQPPAVAGSVHLYVLTVTAAS